MLVTTELSLGKDTDLCIIQEDQVLQYNSNKGGNKLAQRRVIPEVRFPTVEKIGFEHRFTSHNSLISGSFCITMILAGSELKLPFLLSFYQASLLSRAEILETETTLLLL